MRERSETHEERRAWHALEPRQVFDALGTDPDQGLSSEGAASRLERHGPNALPEARRRGLLPIFFHQFRSPLIYLLLGAAGAGAALGHVSDALVILVVVLLNAGIGAFQEGRAERALVALRRMAVLRVRVLRDGVVREREARELVPGDLLSLAAGDAIGADARLVDGTALEVAEAALTGESLPVAKDVPMMREDTLLGDRTNMVFAGTHVTSGSGRAIVVATGLDTEIGRIATLAESTEIEPTPLERRIARFGRAIMLAAGGLVAVVLLIGWWRALPLTEITMIAISQTVSMVPEGLPVALTIALAVGVQRMARRGAIVRRLAAVETLGSTSVICTDKTGTLTRNEMTVVAACLPDGREIAVEGSGYEPLGRFLDGGQECDTHQERELREMLRAAALCNDARLMGPDDHVAQWRIVGDPTEGALLTAAAKGGYSLAALRRAYPRRAELPFDPGDRLMATQHDGPGGSVVFIKGAPEAVLALCEGDEHEGALAAAHALAHRSLRVLAMAEAPNAVIDTRRRFAAFAGRARYLGLLGQMDPPRMEVRDAVEACRRAGIRPVIVTGDHRETGAAVGRAIGVSRKGDLAIDGAQLEHMSDADLQRDLERIAVFARVHPSQKMRIVDAYQARDEVVAMTGDGVNDAPALASADVGVAMGITGTEVAKQASRVVITDDNFATIVHAVEEGRLVARNLRKVILYLFSTSMAEVAVLLGAIAVGFPPPLAAVQILWINLVTEGVITINLIMEPAEGDEMRAPPTPRRKSLIDREILSRMALLTPTMAVSTLGWFVWRIGENVPFAQAQTEAFTILAVCQWFNVLNCRSSRKSAFDRGILRNPWLLGGLLAGNALQFAVIYWSPLGALFHTVPIDVHEFFAIGLVASAVLWVEEGRKAFVRMREARSSSSSFPTTPAVPSSATARR